VNEHSTSGGIVRDCSRSVNHRVRRCTRRAVLVGASTSFLAVHAGADAVAVPIRLQAERLSKVASYDRNFEARAGDRVRSSIPTIGALPHEEELGTYSDAKLTKVYE